MTSRLWSHQEQAVAFALGKPGALLAMEMGTGKTLAVIELIRRAGHRKTLVVAPLSVIPVWPEEVMKHGSALVRVFPGSREEIHRMQDASVVRKQELAEHAWQEARVRGLPFILVLNYESAWRQPFAAWALNQAWDCLVVDESHRAKAPGGRASLFLNQLARRTRQRLGLTGTPMPHSPLDLYAQYRFLNPAIFGTSFVRFRARFTVMGGFNNHQVIGWQRQEELQRKMATIMFRVLAADVLDLPETVSVTRTCRLGPAARRIYRDLSRDFVAQVQAGMVTVGNALVKLLRLQQITSGFIRRDEDEALLEVDTAKADLLADLFEDLPLDEPIVVFCRFHHDLDVVHRVAQAQGRTSLELSGRVNALSAWQMGQAPVLAVQIQSGGLGVDLTRARYACFYSLGFSLGEYLQALARLHRPGQMRSVTNVHLLVEGTVDERVYAALAARQHVIEHLLEQIRARPTAVVAGWVEGEMDGP